MSLHQIRCYFKALQGHDAASLRNMESRSRQVQIADAEKWSRPLPVLLRKSAEPLGSLIADVSTQILTPENKIMQLTSAENEAFS